MDYLLAEAWWYLWYFTKELWQKELDVLEDQNTTSCFGRKQEMMFFWSSGNIFVI